MKGIRAMVGEGRVRAVAVLAAAAAAWGGAAASDDTREARLEAAVRSGSAVVALELADAGLPDTPVARFWKGQAFLLGGRLGQADAELAPLAERVDGAFFREALLGRVAAWSQQGDFQRALDVLQPAFRSGDVAFVAKARLCAAELNLELARPDMLQELVAPVPASPEKEVLLARTALMQENVAEALAIITPVAAKAPPGRLRWAARLLEGRIKAAAGQRVEAATGVVEMVRAEPDAPEVTAAILTLEDIGALELKEVTQLLPEWLAGTTAPVRVAAARFGLAASAAARGEWPAAVAEWRKFLEKWPDHPLAREATRRLVEAHLAAGAPEAARAVARPLLETARWPAERAEASFLLARVETAAGRFTEAARLFGDAALATPDPDAAVAALCDGAWTAIEGELPEFDRWLKALAVRPTQRLRVLSERGYYEAARGRATAQTSLEAYLAAAGDGPATAPASVALAELDLLREPPALGAARQHLRAARNAGPAAALAERIDWLAMWIEEREGKLDDAMQLARHFLVDWPDSKWAPAVQSKMAAWLGRAGDWAGAVKVYRDFAGEEDADPAAAARALYLAGMAELRIPSPDSLDRAIDHWLGAARLDESMFFPARFQQALAKSRMGKNDEALTQLKTLLKDESAVSPMQRNVVLSAQGEIFLRPGPKGETQPAEALAAFQQVADDPRTPAALRRQALCRRADCLRLLGRADEALAGYRSAAAPLLTEPAPPLSAAEVTWAARAGFAAISLLQERQDWAGAVRLATELAQGEGSHAARAGELANRLRLEHFLWEK